MANLQFYMTPGSCSTGIHVLLEELELFFEAHIVNLMAGENRRPEYLALNPSGSVPTLVRADGTVLTDFISIARWLAEAHPRHRLLPDSDEQRAHVLRAMSHAIAVIHGEGFTRVFVSDRYAADAADQAAVESEGRRIVTRGFAQLDSMIVGPSYVLGAFSIADAALFYVELWADRLGIEMPSKCARHYRALLQRPAVRRVLGEEGYHSVLRQHPA